MSLLLKFRPRLLVVWYSNMIIRHRQSPVVSTVMVDKNILSPTGDCTGVYGELGQNSPKTVCTAKKCIHGVKENPATNPTYDSLRRRIVLGIPPAGLGIDSQSTRRVLP
jgi:hypothetical protein